jgi:hypothetical protein
MLVVKERKQINHHCGAEQRLVRSNTDSADCRIAAKTAVTTTQLGILYSSMERLEYKLHSKANHLGSFFGLDQNFPYLNL